MNSFNINTDKISSTSSEINIISDKLKSIGDKVETCVGGLDNSAAKEVRTGLSGTTKAIQGLSSHAGELAKGLKSCAEEYKMTESFIAGQLNGEVLLGDGGSRTKKNKKWYEKLWDGVTGTVSTMLGWFGIHTGGSKSPGTEIAGEPVNMCTGNYLIDIKELVLFGDVDIRFYRHYNSMFKGRRALGSGWSHSYEIELQLLYDENEIIVWWGDARIERFTKKEDDRFYSFYGGYDYIEKNGDDLIYEKKSGEKYHFDENGYLLSITDRNGYALYFEYEESLLKRVRATENRWIEFYYNSEMLLTDVKDSVGRTVEYIYIDGILRKAVSADGYFEIYTYDDKGYLSSITDSEGICYLKNEFDQDGRVLKQFFPDGNSMSYSYDEDKIIFIDRNGSKTVYYHDSKFRHIKTEYEQGCESYKYNDKNERISFVDINGSRWRREYDSEGNITLFEDPTGYVTRYVYDGNGNRTETLFGDGVSVKATYDECGNILSIRDAEDGEINYSYKSGRLEKAVNQDGETEEFLYDADGHIITVTDGAGNSFNYKYDHAGRVVQSTDARGNITEFQYDGLDRVTLIRNAKGYERKYEYDTIGNLVRLTDFDGSEEKWTYNNMSMVESYTNKNGHVFRYEYDSMLNVSKVYLPNGETIEKTYNKANKLIRESRSDGHFREYEYNAGGRMIRENIGGECREFSYDAAGRPVRIVDRNGGIMILERDPSGRITKRILPDGTAINYRYDRNGQCVEEINAKNESRRYSYTPAGRIRSIESFSGTSTEYSYNSNGLLNLVKHENGEVISYKYDENSNLIERSNQRGYSEKSAYNELNRKTQISDSDGRRIKVEYDPAGHIKRTEDREGRVVLYEYYPGGQLSKIKDEAGESTYYAYDPMGYLSAVLKGVSDEDTAQSVLNDPERYQNDSNENIHISTWRRNTDGCTLMTCGATGIQETYEYNSAGRMTIFDDADGNVIKYSYYPGGMLKDKSVNDSKTIHFDYDVMRRMNAVLDQNGKDEFGYDELGRLVDVTYSFGFEVEYDFNSQNEITGISTGSQRSEYEYDEMMRLKSVKTGKDQVKYTYSDGSLHSKEMPGGLSEEYSYTSLGQIERITVRDSDGVFGKTYYKYDERGNISEKCESRRGKETVRTEYRYDDLNRLSIVKENGIDVRSYEYDRCGNRTRYETGKQIILYEYNILNQMVCRKIYDKAANSDEPSEVYRYKYDRRGNLTEEKCGNSVRRFTYDGFNHLEAMTDGKTEYKYLWNGLGYRIGKQKAGETPEYYIIDHNSRYRRVIGIRGKDNRDYLWDNTILSEVCGDSKKWFLHDERGSVTAVSCGDGIDISYTYDEFGRFLSEDSPTQVFGYSGLFLDQELNAWFSHSREYYPEAGRFYTKDDDRFIRISNPETLNLYSYCLNNPVLYIDPSGNDCYIFYLPDFEHTALVEMKELASFYHYDEWQVHLVPVTNAQDLEEAWNSMGEVDGKKVDIDTVIIDTHANSGELIFGKNNTISASDIRNLKEKNVEQLLLYGCNAGHLDHSETNPAAEFARKVNGRQVLASDGTVQLDFYAGIAEEPKPYTSRDDKYFRNQLVNGPRENVGWVEYRYQDGSIKTSPLEKTRMSVGSMTRTLKDRKELYCRERGK